MTKLILSVFAVMFLLTSAPAKAGNDGAAIIGGVIGGLIIGEIFNNRHPHSHNYRVEYVERCRTQWHRYYDTYYGRWVSHPVEQCWVERRNY